MLVAGFHFIFFFLNFWALCLFIPHLFFYPREHLVVAIRNLVIPSDNILSQELVGEIYQFFRSNFSPVYYILISEDIEIIQFYLEHKNCMIIFLQYNISSFSQASTWSRMKGSVFLLIFFWLCWLSKSWILFFRQHDSNLVLLKVIFVSDI